MNEDLPFERVGPNQFRNNLDEYFRDVVTSLCEQLRDAVLMGGDSTRRLYPAAYANDDERNSEWKSMVGGQLIASRLDNLDRVATAIELDILSGDDLSALMRALNDVRLVLAVQLGIEFSSDEEQPFADERDAERYRAYEFLGYLVTYAVQALADQLDASD